MDLFIDIETFSTENLLKTGVYRYSEFGEVMLFAYAFDDEPVECIDLTAGEKLPSRVRVALEDPKVTKWAFNANFERTMIQRCMNISTPPEQWRCSSVLSASLGLPSKLAEVSKVLKFDEDHAKMSSGKRLIRVFCIPRTPTKNNPATRVYPQDDPAAWDEFKKYCAMDVVAEREIHKRLGKYAELGMRPEDWQAWAIDQHINDAGVQVNTRLINNAIDISGALREELLQRAAAITGLENPNSRGQLLKWLRDAEVDAEDLTADTVNDLLKDIEPGVVREVLEIRQLMAKSSVTKYSAANKAVCSDGRLRGMFKFNGAGRTGRWAGQIVQLQNLPRGDLKAKQVPLARDAVLNGDRELLEMMYPSIPNVLATLIRTMLEPKPGHKFVQADFSAIEARMLAWLAGETWRLEVFATHGKIYEASASKMFKIPMEEFERYESEGKKHPARQKGKVAELALGYQGWTGALITMGALDMGIPESELEPIVKAWREANPNIVAYWDAVESAAYAAVDEATKTGRTVRKEVGVVTYEADKNYLFAILPSGRRLAYCSPRIIRNDRGHMAVSFVGIEGKSKKWIRYTTYGGRLVENLCQAISRDCLVEAMERVYLSDYAKTPTLHIHDELVYEVHEDDARDFALLLEDVMAEPIAWAPGLQLAGPAEILPFFMKGD